MNKPTTFINTLVFSLILFIASGNAHADIVEVDGKPRVLLSKKTPRPGMSMKQVRKRYGQPMSKKVSKGPVKRLHPKITIWKYKHYNVYFERSRVLHTVIRLR